MPYRMYHHSNQKHMCHICLLGNDLYSDILRTSVLVRMFHHLGKAQVPGRICLERKLKIVHVLFHFKDNLCRAIKIQVSQKCLSNTA